MITLKSGNEIEKMRAAGQVVAAALSELERIIAPGIATMELDAIAEEVIRSHGAIPSFKGYRGYPAVICAAVNDEVVHGIPGPRRLEEGDIVGIDLGAIKDGWHGDSAVTLAVGEVSEVAKRLISVCREALFAGIEQVQVGARLGDISYAIQAYVEKHGFSVVRDLVGHGIGREMHEDPQVPNFGKAGRGPRLDPGMTLAIEPMVNSGGWAVETLPDKWTIVTKDASLSAHFEHTVAVTKDGPEILTMRPGETRP
ncbi:MAG: type I methionyl aminopeptidase [Armatimonadota bacterium]